MTLSAELFLHVYNLGEGACVRRSMCKTQRLREDVTCGCCWPFLRCRRPCGSGSSPSLNTAASSYTPAIPHLTEESKTGRTAAWCTRIKYRLDLVVLVNKIWKIHENMWKRSFRMKTLFNILLSFYFRFNCLPLTFFYLKSVYWSSVQRPVFIASNNKLKQNLKNEQCDKHHLKWQKPSYWRLTFEFGQPKIT